MKNVAVDPSYYDEERLRPGVREFRCYVCRSRYPISRMAIQDGLPVCIDTCKYEMTKAEAAQNRAWAAGEAARRTAAGILHQLPPYHVGSEMDGVGAVEGISSSFGDYPEPAQLTTGGSPVTVTITGVGFLSTDTITYGGGITNDVAPSLTGTTLWTLSVETVGSRGEFDLTHNGNVFRKVFKVI